MSGSSCASVCARGGNGYGKGGCIISLTRFAHCCASSGFGGGGGEGVAYTKFQKPPAHAKHAPFLTCVSRVSRVSCICAARIYCHL